MRVIVQTRPESGYIQGSMWANAWNHREVGFMADPVDAVVMQ
jgi:hypothetical protein